MMNSGYKRAYKACERCRKVKAKCQLEEEATSCLRCLREQKQCIFPAERSAKRAKTSETGGREIGLSDRLSVSLPPQQNDDNPRNNTTLNSIGHESPTRQARQSSSLGTGVRSRHIASHHTDSQNGQDAHQPNLQPFDASPYANQDVRHPLQTFRQQEPNSGLTTNLRSDVLQTFVTSSSDAIGLLFRAAEQNDSDNTDEQHGSENIRQQDMPSSVYSIPSPGVISSETLSLWEQHRFVRQGWFTPREAISYIEFFFQNLSQLSPVADSFYADHRNHKRLILEQPLLCCTLLMIASRHHDPIKGVGSRTRADFVHNRLWKHIEHLIQRITFGSEKYSLAKSRTLGSIQALLLLTDWHPRALHFPPENDGWDASLAPTIDDTFQQNQNASSDASKRWREDVFEPAKRSDRMSWMLVGLATTLAHELGVFDQSEVDMASPHAVDSSQSKLRIRRLLFLYVTQLSMRLGCTSVFPHSAMQSITYTPRPILSPEDQAREDREVLITKWIEITKLLSTATEMLFANKTAMKQLLKSSRYINLLEHFQPLLRRWLDDFDKMACPSISTSTREVLLVEYHFVRMYINSVGVQAIVERASNYSSSTAWLDHDILRSEFSQDYRFVREVRDSSVEILRIATKISTESMLQYCPVRFFLRVVAASIYLLKTISLGSREADVTRTFEQLELCIQALQHDHADDIHLSSRYAILIARHVRRFKRNFRVQRPGLHTTSVSRAASHGPDPIGVAGRLSTELDRWQSAQQNQGSLSNVSAMPEAASMGDNRIDLGGIAMPFDFDESGMIEDWLAQPFNSQFAPFSMDEFQPSSGLAIDSLDFLWNLAS